MKFNINILKSNFKNYELKTYEYLIWNLLNVIKNRLMKKLNKKFF